MNRMGNLVKKGAMMITGTLDLSGAILDPDPPPVVFPRADGGFDMPPPLVRPAELPLPAYQSPEAARESLTRQSGRLPDLQGRLTAVERQVAGARSRVDLANEGMRAAQAGMKDWRELVLFHEYFHGETGRGVGASHQTGWTALAIRFIEDLARAREAARPAIRSARRGAVAEKEVSP